MAETDAEILAILNVRITSILNGDLASWTVDGVTYTKHNITQLMNLRDRMTAGVNASSTAATGRARVARFRSPG